MKEIIVEEDKQNDVARLKQKDKDKKKQKKKRLNEKRYHSSNINLIKRYRFIFRLKANRLGRGGKVCYMLVRILKIYPDFLKDIF